MANQGWISVHREIFDNWIWKENEPFDKRSAWIDLLLSVNHEDSKVLFDGQLTTVKRGQKITSISKLSKRWGWSRTKVKNFLEILQQDKMILLKIVPHKNTVITIVNYSKFQGVSTSKKASEVQVKDKQSASEVQVKDINNNDNNDNNDNKMMIDKFTQRYTELTGKQISTTSINNLSLIDGSILEKVIDEIEQSTYLKNNADISWIISNLNKIVEGKYRDYTKTETVRNQNSFHNFKQLSDNYDENYFEELARKKREEFRRQLEMEEQGVNG